ncbi:MAG: glutathione ABC transporter ATP-binding protein GsiA [Mameliella sp.]|nr:glutathione ABC transporter ATP-binding protein GsiA [Mameliella sp.]|tara:strand:- start:119 stop:1939 length:1821 start_codon:yes stop_codon:yes gene_type:complete
MQYSDQKVLSVSNLTTSFRVNGAWTPVVRDVSFELFSGETLAIVGESGSGKSVTSLSIMRLLPRHSSRVSGTVMLNGQAITQLSDRAMRNVRGRDASMIFQEPMTSLNPMFTVGDQIMEAVLVHTRGSSRNDARKAALALMEKVRIPSAVSRFDEFPHQFSGGMRQRVMIAIALASRPRLLIADEPTTALDVTIQGQVLDLIKELQREEDMAVLFITHDMGVVAEIADRTMVMYRGELVESGPTAEIFAAPAKPYTRALLTAVPVLGSMIGQTKPLRFGSVDMQSGDVAAPPQTLDTIDHAAPPVVELRNIVNRFDIRGGAMRRCTGRVHAVEDVSFAIQPGETLSLVGESGCGKSTVGRSIMQLEKPLSGDITFGNKSISALSRQDRSALRRDVQMIFQDPFASLNPRMRIGAAIAEPFLVHGLGSKSEARKKVDELLIQVGLEPQHAARFPHEFSGGQKQRICIARALALDPKLIVADESVSALDVSVKAQVINLMLDLQERLGLAYLFISHDMSVVERISHRVAVMCLGEIVEIGPRRDVFENPQHPYTRRLLDAVPVPDPSRRHRERALDNSEIQTPIRGLDYAVPERMFREVAKGHHVMVR